MPRQPAFSKSYLVFNTSCWYLLLYPLLAQTWSRFRPLARKEEERCLLRSFWWLIWLFRCYRVIVSDISKKNSGKMLTENVLVVDIQQCLMITIGHAEQWLGIIHFPSMIFKVSTKRLEPGSRRTKFCDGQTWLKIVAYQTSLQW